MYQVKIENKNMKSKYLKDGVMSCKCSLLLYYFQIMRLFYSTMWGARMHENWGTNHPTHHATFIFRFNFNIPALHFHHHFYLLCHWQKRVIKYSGISSSYGCVNEELAARRKNPTETAEQHKTNFSLPFAKGYSFAWCSKGEKICYRDSGVWSTSPVHH